ncbi:MAG: HAMP domain-containing protein [Desulfobacteraceae bacterium]|nr:HAMP domain-containing protein [Desulfobacteraceae bacterium]
MHKKRKLIWQIFPSFLVIILISLTVVTWYSTRYFKAFFLGNSEKELTVQTKLLQNKFAPVLREGRGSIYRIDDLCKKIGKSVQTRVTIVLPSGVVAGDSSGRIENMGNHLTRPEIQGALEGKKGISTRYSSTLGQHMMYIALPVTRYDQGKPGINQKNQVIAVVRAAVSISDIDKKITVVWNNIMLVLFFTLIAAVIASFYVARRITRPVERMRKEVIEFAKGNLDNRLTPPDTEELSQLARAMNKMAAKLDKKILDFKNRSHELEAVHASMQEGVIAVDNHEQIITVNAAAARIFDFSASVLKKKNILDLSINYELRIFILKALSTHEPVEDDILIKGEGAIILNIHSTALYDTLEKRMGTLIIFHDITRIRRLERMHKEFAANVSHELKTPLTTIKGFIETLQQMLADNQTQKSEIFLKIIEKNVNRMVELINDLLALSRLERLEGTAISFEPYPLATILEEAFYSCQSQATKKNIQIDYTCPENIYAMVDPILMEQAIFNLVDNAVKYNPETTKINIRAVCQKGLAIIEVRDSGVGIAKKHLPKIFNRFYRVDKGRSRNEGGTGLGLAIVKHIVHYHNGKIVVESKKGQGTLFRIYIPLST